MKAFFDKNKKIIIPVVILVVAAVVFLAFRPGAGAQAGQFQTVAINRGNLTATVGATGTVRAMQTASLVWQTNGRVESVNVNVGEIVQVGDVLASLATDSLPQNVILAQADLVTARRNLESLLNSETARAQAQLALVQAEEAYKDAQDDYIGLQYPRATDTKIDDVKSKLDLAEHQVSILEDAYKRVAKRPEGDPLKAEALGALTSARLNRDQLRAEYNWLTGKPTEEEFAKREARMRVAEAQLEDARREWERLEDGTDPDDIAAAEARVAAIEATLNLGRISAPFSGTVTEALPMEGDQVSAGTPAFRLDNLESLLVDVEISEVDINAISIGQPVTLTFDAILGKEYHGEVTQVAKAGTVVQGVVNFTVTVELRDADELVKPGMTAAVNIVVREIEDAILVPNRAVRLVDGKRVVYIMKEGVPEKVEIRLGASSDTMSVVAAGDLEVGDLVVLNPPIEFGPNGGGPFGG